MSNGFYRAFEERHRGSRELIKSRLEAYLPFILPLKNFTTSPRSLDLGCGRGEWLELLTENGFDAYGVDLDDEMLKACRQLGLKSKKIDAVKYLKKEADESHDLVSGFHIAEHLPFEKLQTLVSEALRVLKPAGLMILETPNPENIVVGSKSFYIDPTHERPIPSELLSFVVEHAGFFRVKVVRLQESKDLASNVRLSLMNVLAGASPDYSVVAQKHAEPDVIEHFDSAFSKEYGIALDFLADNYDRQVENRLMQTEDLQAHANQQANELKALQEQLTHQHAHNQWLETEWTAAKEKIEALSHRTGALEVELAQEQSAKEQLHSELAQTHEQLGQAQAQADQSNQELKAVYASWSWRITWPLRKLLDVIKWTFKMPVSLVMWVVRLPERVAYWIVAKAMAFAIKRDTLRLKLLERVNKYPRLKARLNTIGQEEGVLPQDTVPVEGTNQQLQDLNNIPEYTEQPSSDIDTLKKTDDKNYIRPSEVNMKADRVDIGRKLRGIIEEIGKEL